MAPYTGGPSRTQPLRSPESSSKNSTGTSVPGLRPETPPLEGAPTRPPTGPRHATSNTRASASDLHSGQPVRVEAGPTFSAPRLARPNESRSIADLWLRSRYASIPAIPAPVHTDDEAREWFASVVASDREVWIISEDDRPAALLVLDDRWIDQLYVDPRWTGQGLGSVLVSVAKERSPEGLDLWTFQSNLGARRFYERHGFLAIASTEGDNEEAAPDLHYRW
jgi:GNAT superfamily N-acetyltransferase